jgi:hypothetical protein
MPYLTEVPLLYFNMSVVHTCHGFVFSFSEKQREIYNNAKKVKKYKKMLKQQNQQNDPSVSQRHIEVRYADDFDFVLPLFMEFKFILCHKREIFISMFEKEELMLQPEPQNVDLSEVLRA